MNYIADMNKSTNALEDKEYTLYHYQPFNKSYLELLLINRTIYCSNPKSFNDPWDCKPWYNTSILDDEIEYQLHVDFIREHAKKMPLISDEAVNRIAGSRALLEDTLNTLSMGMARDNDHCFRIYCLTPDPENSLMWSHYADKHRGICLEFDAMNVVIGSAKKVCYNSSLPTIKFYEKTNDPMFHLLHKSDVWSYEKEYRIIARESLSVGLDNSPLCCNAGVLKLPENSLRSIIVGCNADYDEVHDFINAIDPSIKIKRMVRSSHQYALRIE